MSNTDHTAADLKTVVAGCGRMGEPMLAALCAAGFDATGFDVRDPSHYGPDNRTITDDPEKLPSDTKILISVVRDIAQTEALLFTDQSLLDRLPELTHVVISSTLSPRYISALKDRISCTVIDAPMSGAAIAAQEARLSFMLGGSDSDIDYLMPLFSAMGAHFHHMGDTGAGMAAKVLNNLLAATNTATTRLVLDWADAAQIDEKKLLDLIHTSSGQNWLASGFEEIEFARDGFADDNTIGILKKDVESALDAAPPGADTTLPETVIRHIRALKPRSR
ncbi:NAD(P)-dependent oxidoreductase [Neptunicoccus cionae]|uniref:NAD(P)-dependent oxidoreductase n=1 Tax=Neptunicoccus cionae TaxID=2035344 RepID=UPI00257033D7|nr:NAD(P)-binding domain-containing protein [Amylibacter cionae]